MHPLSISVTIRDFTLSVFAGFSVAPESVVIVGYVLRTSHSSEWPLQLTTSPELQLVPLHVVMVVAVVKSNAASAIVAKIESTGAIVRVAVDGLKDLFVKIVKRNDVPASSPSSLYLCISLSHASKSAHRAQGLNMVLVARIG